MFMTSNWVCCNWLVWVHSWLQFVKVHNHKYMYNALPQPFWTSHRRCSGAPCVPLCMYCMDISRVQTALRHVSFLFMRIAWHCFCLLYKENNTTRCSIQRENNPKVQYWSVSSQHTCSKFYTFCAGKKLRWGQKE